MKTANRNKVQHHSVARRRLMTSCMAAVGLMVPSSHKTRADPRPGENNQKEKTEMAFMLSKCNLLFCRPGRKCGRNN